MNTPATTGSISQATSPASTLMVPLLVILGGTIFAILGVAHTVLILLDLKTPRRLAPSDLTVAKAMSGTSLQLSSGRTDMWKAWIGFNFSHSLGLLIFAGIAICIGVKLRPIASTYLALLTVVGCLYLALAALYWFRSPLIGVALGTSCFLAAWVFSLC
jgi:hypothetical protein